MREIEIGTKIGGYILCKGEESFMKYVKVKKSIIDISEFKIIEQDSQDVYFYRSYLDRERKAPALIVGDITIDIVYEAIKNSS